MLAWWAILLIVLACLIVGIPVLLFIIYWFNLDMKLVHFVYFALQKHYDKMERDRRL